MLRSVTYPAVLALVAPNRLDKIFQICLYIRRQVADMQYAPLFDIEQVVGTDTKCNGCVCNKFFWRFNDITFIIANGCSGNTCFFSKLLLCPIPLFAKLFYE